MSRGMTQAEELLAKMAKTMKAMADIYEKRFPNNFIVAEARKRVEQAQSLTSVSSSGT